MSETERIRRGGLPSSSEARLRELAAWGGSSSMLTARGQLVAEARGVRPLGSVLGIATGEIGDSYARPPTTAAVGGPQRAWREDGLRISTWGTIRRRALVRLSEEAKLLGANAVIGIVARREFHPSGEGSPPIGHGSWCLTGTAVAIDAWRGRKSSPVMTLASARELSLMLDVGVEPVGVASAMAEVQTTVSRETAGLMRRRQPRNCELQDLTTSVYEARRLAIRRLAADARALGATGVLGLELAFEQHGSMRRTLIPWTLSVHVLATAIRRSARRRLTVAPAVLLGALSDG